MNHDSEKTFNSVWVLNQIDKERCVLQRAESPEDHIRYWPHVFNTYSEAKKKAIENKLLVIENKD